jgi:hypothetical protein
MNTWPLTETLPFQAPSLNIAKMKRSLHFEDTPVLLVPLQGTEFTGFSPELQKNRPSWSKTSSTWKGEMPPKGTRGPLTTGAGFFNSFDIFHYDMQTFSGAILYGPNILYFTYNPGLHFLKVPLPGPMHDSPPKLTS